MGCDIHAHLEIKVDDEWRYYAPIRIERSYMMFGKLAGVRDKDVEPIDAPRGLPSDISFVTNMHQDRMKLDAHSHSWLSLDEICEFVDWCRHFVGWTPAELAFRGSVLEYSGIGVWLFGNGVCDFKKYPIEYPQGMQDVRLVFWFDN